MPRAAAAALIVALAAAPALAEAPVSPDDFEALAEGRTLHFALDGAPFGAEQFLPGRRTVWRFADAPCEPGRWRAEGEAICFDYATQPDPICWRLLRDGDGFAASLIENGVETGFRLELERISPDPLSCPGPDVGS
jgi:hypothetical protein